MIKEKDLISFDELDKLIEKMAERKVLPDLIKELEDLREKYSYSILKASVPE